MKVSRVCPSECFSQKDHNGPQLDRPGGEQRRTGQGTTEVGEKTNMGRTHATVGNSWLQSSGDALKERGKACLLIGRMQR